MKKKEVVLSDAVELRRRAEERHRDRKPEHARPGTEQDTLRLLHELEVHQIELEMQYEELMASRAEVEAGLKRHADLYNFAPVGYFTLGRDGTIRQVNLTGARLLGVERANLVNGRFGLFVAEADRTAFNTFLDGTCEGKPQGAHEVALHREHAPTAPSTGAREASPLVVHIEAVAGEDGQSCYAVVVDITQRRQMEDRQKLAVDILQVLGRPNDMVNIVSDLLHLIKGTTGAEAVGLRLRDGEDYPYYVQNGFPEHFVERENALCARGSDGAILREADGKPFLECMCGNILCGRTDPTKPFFTKGGSFWTNSTTQLLSSTTDKDRGAHARNYCNTVGYESVALIPLRTGQEILVSPPF